MIGLINKCPITAIAGRLRINRVLNEPIRFEETAVFC